MGKDYINKYKRRFNIVGSVPKPNLEDIENEYNVGTSYGNNTDYFIEQTFHSSPSYRIAKIESYQKPHIDKMECRVISVERMGALREVLFRPSAEGLGVGTYMIFDDQKWLIFDIWSSKKVMVERCNDTLIWIDRYGNLNQIDCIASTTDLGSKAKKNKDEIEWNKLDVFLPLGQIFIFIEKRPETTSIELNDRFIFGSSAYEVTGIDDVTAVMANQYGIIQFTLKKSITTSRDNFETRIAYNNYNESEKEKPSVEPNLPPDTEGEKGRIW